MSKDNTTVADDLQGLIDHLRAVADDGKTPSGAAHLMRCAAERLTALAQAEQPVVVKPLKWDRQNADGTIRIASALPGEYWAWEFAGTGYWAWGSMPGKEVPGGLAGAQAAAEADYERRILSTLVHPPAKREARANVDASILRERISRAIFDPFQTEGRRGERTLVDWKTDAVMRVLGYATTEGSDNA
jgi:hypothetical protein